ncbi:helicase-related protein [Escherichia coli]
MKKPTTPERDQLQAIFDAVDELSQENHGDILIFMSGQREIQEYRRCAEQAKSASYRNLAAYARLSNSEQNRVFQSHSGRRIVLATNVAETSLTIAGY